MLAFTLLPTLLTECTPPLCKFCNKLFKKLCSPALEDWFEAEPAAGTAIAVPPFVALVKFLNVAFRLAVAEFAAPPELKLWMSVLSADARLP